MKLSDYSIANPVKVAVGSILAVVSGLIAFSQIPVQLTPEVVQPVITVETRWPGASPEEIEKEIIAPQEDMLQDIEGITHFASDIGDGFGAIEMEFQVGTDLNATLLRVSNQLDQIRDFPEDADEPDIETVSMNSNSIAYFSVMPAAPSVEQLQAFREKHPELADAIDPLITSWTPDSSKIYALAAKHPQIRELLVNDPNVADMRTFIEDEICKRIARVPGVSLARVWGGAEQQLRVTVDPVKLATHRITIAQLRQALTSASADVSGGDLWEGKRRYIIRTLGKFYRPEQAAEVVVAYRDGAPVYVKDLATVELRPSKTQGIGRQKGVDSLTVAVDRQSGSNVLAVMEGVKAAAAEMNDGLLKAHHLYLLQTYDETVYITQATDVVWDNILVGSALTILVLYLFLRNVRSTLVITLSIPISCIATFLVIRLLGRSMNVVSLAGMAFAVGIVVDSANIVLENIFSRYQRGEQPMVAASRGTTEVWGAILASTFTTVSVFLPVVFIQQEAGQLFRDIAIAMTAGVLISFVVSLTVIPAASARILDEREPHKKPQRTTRYPRLQKFSRWLDWMGQQFVAGVVWATNRLQAGKINNFTMMLVIVLFGVGAVGLVKTDYEPRATWPYWIPHPSIWGLIAAGIATAVFIPLALVYRRMAIAIMSIIFSLGLSYKMMLPAEYLPQGNKNQVRANLQPPPGYNMDRLAEFAKTVESRLRKYWEAEPGSPEAAALDGPILDSYFVVVRGTSLFMGARALEPSRAHEMVGVIRKATEGLPGVTSFASQSSLFERNRSGGRTIEIEVTGPELNKLVELAGGIKKSVEEIYPPQTQTAVRTFPGLDLGATELHVRRDLEKAAELGVSTAELGYAVNALIDGAYAGTFWHEGKEIDLVIYGDEKYIEHTQDVANMPIGTPGGELVRIGDVADVILTAGPETISRVDRQRAITIFVLPGSEIALEDAMNQIETQVLAPLRDSGELSGLYHLRLAGTADKLRQMQSALSGSLLLALLITYLLIAGLYESFLYPLVVMISVPLAAIGGFAALRILNMFTTQQLDTLTMLGFIFLIGTVVNNAILIVDQTLNYIRNEHMDHRSAVERSVAGRIRPIFMTTATTLLGMLPLAVSPGAGTELYRGLGAVVLGGLTVSTIFTLFLVPMLFTLSYEFKLWLGGKEKKVDYDALETAIATDIQAVSEYEFAAAASHAHGNGNGNGNGNGHGLESLTKTGKPTGV